MTTLDTIDKLNDLYNDMEQIRLDIEAAQDGIAEALLSYHKAMEAIIDENRQP